MRPVASVLALSAMVMRTAKVKLSRRCRCSLRTEFSSEACSLKTGTTISTTGTPGVVSATLGRAAERISVMISMLGAYGVPPVGARCEPAMR